MFELKLQRDGTRVGTLRTRAGDVLTPTFMPDGTRGAVKSLTPEMVRSTGVQVVLANTYHLHLQPGEDTVAALGGLHTFTGQGLPMLTDSGGFQVFSLAHINKITEDGVTFKDPRSGDTIFLSPEKSIQIQMKLGADMMVAFDDVTALDDAGRGRTKEAFDRTHRWLERSLAEFQRLTTDMKDDERPLLFGVVQGGLDKDLRKQSLEIVQSLPVDGIAIGGLSVGESREEMYDMLAHLAPLYDDSPRPRFLLGVGDPVDLRFAIEHGIDMLDCVLPTRNARHGTVWIHKPCTCAKKGSKATLADTSRTASDFGSLRGSVDVPAVHLPETSQNKTIISLACKTCGDERLNLKSEVHAMSTEPIEQGCDCYTCQQGFSRGFLRHQFKVGEPLAGTLASIHNIRYLQRICEEYGKR
jgi:queuine tRNA-ribosyltransferase